MPEYYRTETGLFYKKYKNGLSLRVSKNEYQKNMKDYISSHKLKNRPASKRTSRRKTVSRKKSKTLVEQMCDYTVKEKIVKNLEEYKEGKFANRKQAIAVGYSQTKKQLPICIRFLDKNGKEVKKH